MVDFLLRGSWIAFHLKFFETEDVQMNSGTQIYLQSVVAHVPNKIV